MRHKHKKFSSEYIEFRSHWTIHWSILMRKFFRYKIDKRLDDLIKYIMKYGKLDITKSNNSDVAIKIDGIYLFINYYIDYDNSYIFCGSCYAYKKYDYHGIHYGEKVWDKAIPSRKVCVDFQKWINERIKKAKRLKFYPNENGMLYD